MACDGDAVLVVLAALVDLVVSYGGVLLFHDGGAPPLVAQHCYRSAHYTRNISSTSCS